MRTAQVVFVLISTCLLHPSETPAATLHVSPAGDSTTGDSWPAAFTTITDALLHSASGDHIWIRAGTYSESIEMVTGVEIYGGFDGTERLDRFDLQDPVRKRVTIDATGTGKRVVLGANDTVLDGVTITGGTSNLGGGLACFSCDMEIRDCTFSGNIASGENIDSFGGGIYATASSLRILGCSFIENTIAVTGSEIVGASREASGGGLYADNSTVFVSHSLFQENSCINKTVNLKGGFSQIAAVSRGGGIYSSGFIHMDKCLIRKNSLESEGSAIRLVMDGAGLFLRNEWEILGTKISDNTEGGLGSYVGISVRGAGLFFDGSGSIENTAILHNSGGGFSYGGGGVGRIGTNLWGNGDCIYVSTTISGGGSLFLRGTHRFNNSILYSPGPQSQFNDGTTEDMEVSHSIVFPEVDGFHGNGNLFVDPLIFQDGSLYFNSPAIDAGSVVGATQDIDGNPRPVDIPGVGIEGPGAFDIGAYESQLADVSRQALFVSPDGDDSNGRSWETAFRSISSAIHASIPGAEIRVASATYRERVELRPYIRLIGGFASGLNGTDIPGPDPIANPTIISASGLNEIVIRGATATVVDGFHITGGRSYQCGGMLVEDASMTIRRCQIYDNEMMNRDIIEGGGILGLDCVLSVFESTIRDNRLLYVTPKAAGRAHSEFGAGIAIKNGVLNLTDCVIENHRMIYSPPPGQEMRDAILNGCGLYVVGDVHLERTIVRDNRIVGSRDRNLIENRGGGVFVRGRFTASSCLFSENEVSGIVSGAIARFEGGAIFVEGISHIENSIFSRNKVDGAQSSGSTLLNLGSQVANVGSSKFINCTFIEAENRFFNCFDGIDFQFINCAIDCEESANTVSSTFVTMEHCAIPGGYPGVGNIDFNDEFVDPDAMDFRLRPMSPLIDAGTRTDLTTDWGGNPRPVDAPRVGVEGPHAFDIGALEFQLDELPFTDPDGNRILNEIDLFLLQQEWRRSEGIPPSSTPELKTNFNQDTQVDTMDLLIFLQDWFRNH